MARGGTVAGDLIPWQRFTTPRLQDAICDTGKCFYPESPVIVINCTIQQGEQHRLSKNSTHKKEQIANTSETPQGMHYSAGEELKRFHLPQGKIFHHPTIFW